VGGRCCERGLESCTLGIAKGTLVGICSRSRQHAFPVVVISLERHRLYIASSTPLQNAHLMHHLHPLASPPPLSLSLKTATSNTPPPSLPSPLSLHIHIPIPITPHPPPPSYSNSIIPPPRPPALLSPQQLPCLLRDRLPPLPIHHASRPPDFPSLFLHVRHHLVLGVRVPALGGLAPSAHSSVSRL